MGISQGKTSPRAGIFIFKSFYLFAKTRVFENEEGDHSVTGSLGFNVNRKKADSFSFTFFAVFKNCSPRPSFSSANVKISAFSKNFHMQEFDQIHWSYFYDKLFDFCLKWKYILNPQIAFQNDSKIRFRPMIACRFPSIAFMIFFNKHMPLSDCEMFSLWNYESFCSFCDDIEFGVFDKRLKWLKKIFNPSVARWRGRFEIAARGGLILPSEVTKPRNIGE